MILSLFSFRSNVDFDSLSLMGSKAMLFSKATLQAVNMVCLLSKKHSFDHKMISTAILFPSAN